MIGRIESLARESKATVGMGMATRGDAAESSASTAEAEGLGPIHLYTDPLALVSALVGGEIDVAVRGTLGAHDMMSAFDVELSAPSRLMQRVALMVRRDRSSFLLAPVGIDEGRDLEERWALMKAAAALIEDMGERPRAAVMAMGRSEDVDRGEAISISVRECQALSAAAESAGIEAECVGILLERALERANLIVAPDGVTGNLVFRALHYAAGMEGWGAPALGLAPLLYVDTSRGRSDYTGAIKLACAMAHLRARGL